MRTKKYYNTKRSHNTKWSHKTKRRKNGGGWFTNIFKSKSQKAAEQAAAAQQELAAQQARQLETERQQKFAQRDVAVTAEKNVVEKQWKKEDEEGWETPEELQNKIKKLSLVELATRVNNQKAINNFLQKEIATTQTEVSTCYPNGKDVIEKAKMKDLQNELYILKNQEEDFRLERKVLKEMIKKTPECKEQRKLAKQKKKKGPTSEEKEEEDVFFDAEEEPEEEPEEELEEELEVPKEEEIATGEEINPEEFMLVDS